MEIEDIDCLKYKGRGVGTQVIQFLLHILEGTGIKEVFAKISPVDYENRYKLYNFYVNINGFELEKEVTEATWGLVRKRL